MIRNRRPPGRRIARQRETSSTRTDPGPPVTILYSGPQTEAPMVRETQRRIETDAVHPELPDSNRPRPPW